MEAARQVALQLQTTRVATAFNFPPSQSPKIKQMEDILKIFYNMKAGAELFSYSDWTILPRDLPQPWSNTSRTGGGSHQISISRHVEIVVVNSCHQISPNEESAPRLVWMIKPEKPRVRVIFLSKHTNTINLLFSRRWGRGRYDQILLVVFKS